MFNLPKKIDDIFIILFLNFVLQHVASHQFILVTLAILIVCHIYGVDSLQLWPL